MVLVLVCLALVAMAARHPSLISPTALGERYPSWLSGPLGFLWPGAVPREHTVQLLISGAFGLLFVAYLLVLRSAATIRTSWLLAAIVALHVIFLLGPPLEYTDIFNYINYARLGVVHHLDPYTTLPIDGPHNDPAYALSNWHNLRSPYGQLFTLITYALVPFGVAGAFWVFKVIVGLCSAALLMLVWRLAVMLGRSPKLAIALVGLNPIVLVWGLGGAHNDFLMVLAAFGALYLLIATRVRDRPSARTGLLGPELAAGVLLMAAVGIKASAVIFIPVALAIAPRRRHLLAGLVGAALVLALASLAVFGAHLGGVRSQSTLVSPEGIPNLLGIVLGLGGETSGLRTVLTGLAALVVLAAAARALRHPSEAIECCCVSALALIFTLGWSAPWYVLWALPFIALVRVNRWRWLIVAYTLYALVASSPSLADIENGLNFHPRRDRLGREHVAQFDFLGAK